MSPLQHRRIVPAWLGQALGLLFAVSMLQADPAAFEKANKLYNDDQYAEAAEAYLQISKNGVSANLLFNLGNAYFKADQLGRSMAAYHRALQLAPRDSDIKMNLSFAQQKALTKPIEPTLRQAWLRNLSQGEWTGLASFAGTILLILLTLRQVKKTGGPGTVWVQVTGAITFIAVLLLIMALIDRSGNKRAFAVQDGVVVRIGPVEQSPEIFQATDGMEFVVLGHNENFVNVRSSNGATGWVRDTDVAFTQP